MFASRPLAEMQAEQAAEKQRSYTDAPAIAAETAQAVRPAPMPTLDIHFEDLPDQDYAEFNFPLKTTPGVVYTLGIDDDAVLYEVMDVAAEGTPTDILDFFFAATLRRAVYADGSPVEKPLKYFLKATDPKRADQRESRRYLMSVVTTAIDQWTEELTDTSMRPVNRAQRRSRRR
jgi:hypothetical protein